MYETHFNVRPMAAEAEDFILTNNACVVVIEMIIGPKWNDIAMFNNSFTTRVTA